ncbi:hypothetical protein MOSE0_N01574 [Monosporozyma servazzii]
MATYNDALQYIGSSWVNLLLPFLQGFMLGLGELTAHELGFRFRWFNRPVLSKVFPQSRVRRVSTVL